MRNENGIDIDIEALVLVVQDDVLDVEDDRCPR